MRALVTNDDGLQSEGLRRLADAACGFGFDVVVAAPLRDSSGTSASLTAIEADGRIIVEEHELPGLDNVPTFGVGATPGFIALIATRGAFGAVPEVVVSGINCGLNTGNAVLHSGTVGAAMTARVHGCRALAVSLDVGERLHWESASAVTGRALQWLLDLDDEVVLNVNVPNVAEHELRGIRQGTLAPFGTVQTTIAESGKGWVRLGVTGDDRTVDPGSDAALVAAGYASVTPLQPLCTSTNVRLQL